MRESQPALNAQPGPTRMLLACLSASPALLVISQQPLAAHSALPAVPEPQWLGTWPTTTRLGIQACTLSLPQLHVLLAQRVTTSLFQDLPPASPALLASSPMLLDLLPAGNALLERHLHLPQMPVLAAPLDTSPPLRPVVLACPALLDGTRTQLTKAPVFPALPASSPLSLAHLVALPALLAPLPIRQACPVAWSARLVSMPMPQLVPAGAKPAPLEPTSLVKLQPLKLTASLARLTKSLHGLA